MNKTPKPSSTQMQNLAPEPPPVEFDPSIPSAEEMLERLHSVDLNYFDSETIFNELKGKSVWISAMTIPVTLVTLSLFTFIGMLFDQPIVGFVIAALLLFWISRLIDAKDQNLRFEAHNEVIRRIEETEGSFGLIPHFKHFLPNRYRHLWQSLRKGRYHYIEQYIQAVHLLQTKLENEKFIRIWQLKYPQFLPAPEEYSDISEEHTMTADKKAAKAKT